MEAPSKTPEIVDVDTTKAQAPTPTPGQTRAVAAQMVSEIQWLANKVAEQSMTFAEHQRARELFRFLLGDFEQRLQ